MMLVVSGGGARSSRQVTLQWRCFIYKTAVIIEMMALVVDLGGSRSFSAISLIIYKPAVGINIPVVVVSGAGAPSSTKLTL